MRYTPDGTPRHNFSVATRQVGRRSACLAVRWVKDRSRQDWELTTWFRVTTWRKLAEATNNSWRGSAGFVEGELRAMPERIRTRASDGERREHRQLRGNGGRQVPGKREGTAVRRG